jgi:hypothetical protein
MLGFTLCACGSVGGADLPDAGPGGDAAVDAPARGTVRVTVLDPSGAGAPAVGASVVFLDPDGTLVKRVATDTAGRADAEVLAGASVTSVVLNNTSYQLQTVLAVKPGDDIVLGFKNGDSTTAGTFTISFPAHAGATSYTVATPCSTPSFSAPASGPPAPVTVTIFNECRLSRMELVVIPHDANGPMAALAKADVAFVSGGSTVIAGSYQGLRNLTSSYTNINPQIANLGVNRAVPDAFGFTSSDSVTMPTSTAIFNLMGPQTASGLVTTSATNSTRSVQNIRQSISGMAATYGLDMGATLLPWLGTPSYDAAAGKVVIPVDTTGTSNATPDVLRIVAAYRRTDASNVTTNFAWTIFAPDVADIVLPALPVELGGINPTASDVVNVTTAAILEMDTVSGYDAIRNDLAAAFTLYTSSRPPAGTVRFSRAPIIRQL